VPAFPFSSTASTELNQLAFDQISSHPQTMSQASPSSETLDVRSGLLLALKTFSIVVGCFLLLLLILLVAIIQPGPSGVVASLRLADGSEYMVTQRFNWSAEPYTVAFYLRSPGGQWGWCYIDHEAMRWRNVALKHDPNTDVITVTKGGIWQAAFNRKRSTFALGDGKPKRELAAPQDYMEPEFPFPK